MLTSLTKISQQPSGTDSNQVIQKQQPRTALCSNSFKKGSSHFPRKAVPPYLIQQLYLMARINLSLSSTVHNRWVLPLGIRAQREN